MLDALSRSELARLQSASRQDEFTGAEMVIAIYRTDRVAVETILPPPLKPTLTPTAVAFIGRDPQTSFGSVYNEGALFVQGRLGAEVGWYGVAMPVDDDTAMIGWTASRHGTWDNTMLPGEVVGRAWNVWRFLPHAFFKTDAVAFLLRSTEDKAPQDANPTQRRN